MHKKNITGFSHLLKAFNNGFSVYKATMPYNLNWIRNFKFVFEFLTKNPITIFDIGARGYSLEELENLKRHVNYIAFDADQDEAKRLNETGKEMGFNSFEVYPYFVGKEIGVQNFNLFNNPGESSQLNPNVNYQKYFAPDFFIKKTVQVNGITLDSFMQDKDVDVIKLDTQGTEFDILINGQKAIDKALLIEAEVEFFEMYKNQKLFHDVCDVLYKRNFTLLYLNRVFKSRLNFRGYSRGQMIFGDALFGLNENAVALLSLEKKKKYCILLINYGLIDYAFDIFLADETLRMKSPELENFFAGGSDTNSPLQKIKRVLWMQIEKLIVFLLFLRKTNQLNSDSDRSWPIR